MSDFRPLSADFSVAPQISIEDVAEAKAAGFAMLVNNRPDGEAADQPASAELAQAAQAHGLAWRHVPVIQAPRMRRMGRDPLAADAALNTGTQY